MTDPILRFSARAVPDLYDARLIEEMERHLAHPSNARTGDIIGIEQDFRLAQSISAYPATHFIRKTSDRSAQAERWIDLPEAVRPGLAVLAATLHAVGVLRSVAFQNAVESFDRSTGDPLFMTLVAMRPAALLMVENHVDTVFEGEYFEEEVTQEILDDAMTVLVPRQMDSRHQAVAALAEIAPCIPYFSHFAAVRDLDTDRPVPVGSPEP